MNGGEKFSRVKTSFREQKFITEMKFFIAFSVLILSFISCACAGDNPRRNREKFSSFESLNVGVSHDKHTTSVKRNSFLPPQSSSSRNYFRDLISRNEGANNDNTIEYNIDPSFSNFLLQKQKRPQYETTNGGALYRLTREVQVKQGRLTGIVREFHAQTRLNNVDQFLGIPYAEAPVGSRRFMPPSSPLPWLDVKRANRMEAVCPQKLPNLSDPSGYNKGRYDQIKRLLPYLKNESEDCLYLNLYVTSYGKFVGWEFMWWEDWGSYLNSVTLNLFKFFYFLMMQSFPLNHLKQPHWWTLPVVLKEKRSYKSTGCQFSHAKPIAEISDVLKTSARTKTFPGVFLASSNLKTFITATQKVFFLSIPWFFLSQKHATLPWKKKNFLVVLSLFIYTISSNTHVLFLLAVGETCATVRHVVVCLVKNRNLHA